MALPLLTAGLSIGTGIAVIGLLSHAIQTASFTGQLSLLLGLGVGVDYALFIVTRYRQGLLRGLSGEKAVVEAVDTSGRAVLFAGMIVCIAMLGMFSLGISFLSGVVIAVSIVVALTVVAALTLLPAVLGLFGLGVLRRRERRALKAGRLLVSDESAGWARWARLIGKRPAVFAALAAIVMLVIAIPFLSMRVGSADAGSDPAGSTTRNAYDLLAKGFGPGYNRQLQLVAQVSGPDAFVPVFLFAILFGLSMDYEVFLVTRIYEEWHRRRDNHEAVIHGLAATGRTITAAAAIMVLVFGAFVLGGERIIDLFGLGLASAVLLDALIVRSVLVPALMLILGEANWKLPARLESLLPHLRVEGSSARRRVPVTRPEPEPSAG
jgi:uncharacterized membrane protein YdfJ with MMPL/SSD domain